jgi:hypothetical protein
VPIIADDIFVSQGFTSASLVEERGWILKKATSVIVVAGTFSS